MNGMMFAFTEVPTQGMVTAPNGFGLSTAGKQKNAVFQYIFQAVHQEVEEIKISDEIELDEAMLTLLFQMLGLDEHADLQSDEIIEQMIEAGITIDETLVKQLLEKIQTEQQRVEGTTEQVIYFPFMQVEENVAMNMLQLEQMVTEIARLFKDINMDDGMSPNTSALLRLLEQWTSLSESEKNQLETMIAEQLTEKDETVWKQLVHIYESRTKMAQSGHYTSDASISRMDLENWLQQAVERQVSVTNPTVNHYGSNEHVQMNMSTQEQFVIHANSMERVEQISNQLMTQFTNIMKSSQFTKQPNHELMIQLQPENLGHMIVRFTQVDDELTVRIIVSSLATKGMLEANIDKLKHMFLPHQVTIEKDESISDEMYVKEDLDEEELEEQRTSHEGEEKHQEDGASDELDFQTIFEQIDLTGWEAEEIDEN